MKEPQSYLALGIVLGTTFGLLLDNFVLWMCLGLVIGAALDEKRRRETDKDDDDAT
ncbi:hypothetical protein [Qipengyuania sp. JC766]|uniref:hypothetical protein n=1 Tax=Qipengyuania sp. JC766 TaxID=3232139 RepID=UPI00345930FC